MGIETVSPTSSSPDLTPPEGAQDVSQERPLPQPTSSPGASAGGMLGGLSSLQENRASSQAGPSSVRPPQAATLAKLARTAGATSRPLGPSASHAAPVRAPVPPTHADVNAVRKRAQDLGAMEARLAALRQPPEPQRAEAAMPASEAGIRKQIDVLESKHHDAQRNASPLAQQCKTAFDEMARHGVALARKVDLLERYQGQLDEAGPAPVSQARPRPVAARPTVPDRMAALEREIGLLKGSRKKAAEEAMAVAVRDQLRERGSWSLMKTAGSAISGAAKKILLGKGSPIDEDLEASIGLWLDNWLQQQGAEPPRGRRNRNATPAEQFTADLDVAFRHIALAARPEASGADATVALARFLHLLSNLECRGFGEREKTKIARHLSVCLVVNNLGNQAPVRSFQGQAVAYLKPSEGGHDIEKTTVRDTFNQVEHIRTEFNKANPRAGVMGGADLYKGSSLIRARTQLNQLAERLAPNRDNLEIVLKAVERQLVEDLKATAPNQHRRDDIEELGKKVAGNLGPVYSQMIDQLNTERAQLAKTPVRRAPAAAQASTARAAGPDRDQLAITVNRLRGAVLEYADKRREAFEHHATLSGKQLDASDELEDIARQLDDAHRALQAVRDEKRRALDESATRSEQAASLERDIDAGWREALADPALGRLISPTALARALRMHVGQTPAQLHARVRRDDRTARTGTFRSGPELLRTIAEIAEHELSKPNSPLRAGSREALRRIEQHHPGGQINMLYDHGRTIGHGVRASDTAGAPPARTGTSQYTVGWEEGEGARIGHLHPWVSPY